MIGNGRVKEGNYMLEANLSKLTELSSQKEHWTLFSQRGFNDIIHRKERRKAPGPGFLLSLEVKTVPKPRKVN